MTAFSSHFHVFAFRHAVVLMCSPVARSSGGGQCSHLPAKLAARKSYIIVIIVYYAKWQHRTLKYNTAIKSIKILQLLLHDRNALQNSTDNARNLLKATLVTREAKQFSFQGDSDVISFHISASCFSQPSCG